MKFLKENKNVTKWIIIAIIALLLLFVIKIFILPMFGGDPYGNRLDGMNEVKVNNDSVTRMKQELEKEEKIEKVEYDLKGRIINVEIKFSSGTSKDDAKGLANKVLEYFTEGQKTYYDLQVYLLSDGENSEYPFIGYKHKTSDGLVWTNN